MHKRCTKFTLRQRPEHNRITSNKIMYTRRTSTFTNMHNRSSRASPPTVLNKQGNVIPEPATGGDTAWESNAQQIMFSRLPLDHTCFRNVIATHTLHWVWHGHVTARYVCVWASCTQQLAASLGASKEHTKVETCTSSKQTNNIKHAQAICQSHMWAFIQQTKRILSSAVTPLATGNTTQTPTHKPTQNCKHSSTQQHQSKSNPTRMSHHNNIRWIPSTTHRF